VVADRRGEPAPLPREGRPEKAPVILHASLKPRPAATLRQAPSCATEKRLTLQPYRQDALPKAQTEAMSAAFTREESAEILRGIPGLKTRHLGDLHCLSPSLRMLASEARV
jgi:hypothetical protein